MRAILIDPVAKTVSEVEYNGDYRQIDVLLSDKDNGLNVDCFTVVSIDDDDDIFVDDEGLLKDPKHFFVWKGYGQPLAGRGLILGHRGDGESIATTLKLDEVRDNVAFVKLSVAGFDTTEGVKIDERLGPEPINYIRTVPVFGPPKEDEP